jgi:DNA-binding NtrC family response regulator
MRQVLGESAPIAAVREQAARLLRSASGPGRRVPPILVLGETGTGKGLLADAIHRASGRAFRPASLDHLAVPDTVDEIILGRTHRLDEALKHALEVAAVMAWRCPVPGRCP